MSHTCCNQHTHSSDCLTKESLETVSLDQEQSTGLNAIELAELFWPDTQIFDHRVYLHLPDEEDYQALIEELDGDKVAIQALYNHIHLVEVFGEQADRQELIEAGTRLQNCWNFCFRSRYPNRNIIVAFDVADEDTVDDLQITVYEEL